MPRPVAVLGVLFSLMAPFCARAAERSVAGQLKNPDAWKTLGRQGCLAIPSRARWEAIEKLLTGLGWEKPAPDPLVAVDFAREQIVCLFRSGDQSDRFSVHRLTLDSKHAELAAVMSYVIYKSHAPTPDKAQLEWSTTLTPDSGDIVDGLRGVIRVEKPARITGLYMQSAGETKDFRTKAQVPLWGGNLATNGVQVTVKAAAGAF